MKTLVITSGGFDPLHAGHISAFERMAKVGDLCVLVNDDLWLREKKEKEFQGVRERIAIIRALRCVKLAFFADYYGDSVITSLNHTITNLRKDYDRFVFAKSGDRTHENSPEYQWCLENDVEWLEVESDYPDLHSSQILSGWQNQPVERSWGYYLTSIPFITENENSDLAKAKVLHVLPGKSLSLQSHKHREEIWHVIGGYGLSKVDEFTIALNKGRTHRIPKNSRHQITNTGDKLLVILEWQIGESVDESDIIRYTDSSATERSH